MNGQLMVPLDYKLLLTVVLSIIGGFGALLRLSLHLFEKHLDERAKKEADLFEGLERRIEDSIANHQRLMDQRLSSFEDSMRRERERLSTLEVQHRALNDSLAMRFVQREDFIRFASSIDNKIDRLGELFTRFTMQRDER